jgi:hypothetical protein
VEIWYECKQCSYSTKDLDSVWLHEDQTGHEMTEPDGSTPGWTDYRGQQPGNQQGEQAGGSA